MRAGATEFDRMADLRGVRAACALIERHFPMAVR